MTPIGADDFDTILSKSEGKLRFTKKEAKERISKFIIHNLKKNRRIRNEEIDNLRICYIR